MLHPLHGADPSTVARIVRGAGPIPVRGWVTLAAVAASTVARRPVDLAEHLYVRHRLRRHGTLPSPVFIVGHWRSGTTHLYNMLGLSPDLAFVTPFATGMPWSFMLLERTAGPLLERLLPQERYVDAVRVNAEAPQEDEIGLANMTTPSFYHGVYFPRRFAREMRRGIFFDGCGDGEIRAWQDRLRLFVDKVSLDFGGHPALVKNPAHTAKIDRLLEIWPDARFIHIVRNPFHVYQSTRRFFLSLLDLLALQPYDAVEVEEVFTDTYSRMMARLIDAASRLPPDRFVEVRYEDVERDPRGEVARIVRQLDLCDPDRLDERVSAYLEATAGYSKSTREVPDDVAERVGRVWRPFVEHWNYAPVAG